MSHRSALIAWMGLVVAVAQGGEVRKWRSAAGDTVEAEYVTDAGSTVVLKKLDGQKLRVPIAVLCENDQRYIYNQKPPTLDINVKISTDRSSTDYWGDYKVEKLGCTVEVKKKSLRPFFCTYKAHVYLIGEDQRDGEFILLDTATSSFDLTDEEERFHTFSLDTVKLKYDTYGVNYGVKFESYLVCIMDDDGQVLAWKGDKNWYERLHVLLGKKPGDMFDTKRRPIKTVFRDYVQD